MPRSPMIYGPNQTAQNVVSGGVTLPGSTSGSTTVTSVAAPTTYTITLPNAVPVTAGSVVTADTSANLSFTAQLPIANGGTGQASANSSLNALLPSQTGIDGYQTLISDGTNTHWNNPFNYSSTFDDMTGDSSSANVPSGPLGLLNYGNNGGGMINPANITGSIAGRWGFAGFFTGVSNNNSGLGGFTANGATTYCGQVQTLTITGAVNIPVLATAGVDYVIELGFRNNIITAGFTQNAMGILYQRSTSTNWQGYTSRAGTSTTVTSSTAVTTGWWNFKMVVTSTAVDFYIAQPGNAWTHIGQSTTNLPDSTHTCWLNPVIYKASTSTTASQMTLDWLKVDVTFASAR